MAEGIDKTYENRLRRAAGRQGLFLSKSRRRDKLATDWGWTVMRGRRRLAHFTDIADVERWLRVHALPQLGSYTLGHLASRPGVVQEWVRGLPSGNHGKSVYTTLATVLNAAVADRLIPSSPCHGAGIRNDRPRADSRLVVPWS